MHTLHHIAVEAASSKAAFRSVKLFVEERIASGEFWSDWAVVGGGRWSEHSKDDHEDTPKDVISYVKNKDTFESALQITRESRKQEMKRTIENIAGEGEAALVIAALEYAKKGDCEPYNMNSYMFLKVTEVLCGRWTPDTFFYDMKDQTTSFSYLEERVKDNPEEQYLVPVDFHF